MSDINDVQASFVVNQLRVQLQTFTLVVHQHFDPATIRVFTQNVTHSLGKFYLVVPPTSLQGQTTVYLQLTGRELNHNAIFDVKLLVVYR